MSRGRAENSSYWLNDAHCHVNSIIGQHTSLITSSDFTGDSLSPRSAERLSPRSAERLSPRSAERLSPRSAERLSPRSAERLSPRSAERLSPRSAERLSPWSAERRRRPRKKHRTVMRDRPLDDTSESRLWMTSHYDDDTLGSYLSPETPALSPTMPTESGVSHEAKEIYTELHDINEQLKCEFRLMHEKGVVLRERETKLDAKEASLHQLIKKGVETRMEQIGRAHSTELSALEHQWKEKARANKRHKEGFVTLKNANEVLRKEMDVLRVDHEKLERQYSSLQSRLVNLQRKKTFDREGEKVANAEKRMSGEEVRLKSLPSKTRSQLRSTSEELLTVIFEWLANIYLQPAISMLPDKPLDGAVKERCLKVLPNVVDILRELPTGHEMTYPILQYVYWSLEHIDHFNGQSGCSPLACSLRRLGEAMYIPARATFLLIEDRDIKKVVKKNKEGAFIRIASLPIRFLSTLILLRTVTQVDHLVSAFEVLKNDLEFEAAKELYMHYKATPVILLHVKANCKPVTNAAVDIFLQMCLESPSQQAFLVSCSDTAWFHEIALIWRVTGIEENLLEKLAILLQKLSKIRGNKKFFDSSGIIFLAQKMVRLINDDTSFLSINLKSIIYNLGPLSRGSCNSLYRSDSITLNRSNSSLVNRPDSPSFNQPDSTLVNRPDPTSVNRPDSTLVNRPDSTLVNRPDSTLVNRPDSTSVNGVDSIVMNQSDLISLKRSHSNLLNRLDADLLNRPDSAFVNRPNSALLNQIDSALKRPASAN